MKTNQKKTARRIIRPTLKRTGVLLRRLRKLEAPLKMLGDGEDLGAKAKGEVIQARVKKQRQQIGSYLAGVTDPRRAWRSWPKKIQRELGLLPPVAQGATALAGVAPAAGSFLAGADGGEKGEDERDGEDPNQNGVVSHGGEANAS